jgi:hypothetical protein
MINEVAGSWLYINATPPHMSTTNSDIVGGLLRRLLFLSIEYLNTMIAWSLAGRGHFSWVGCISRRLISCLHLSLSSSYPSPAPLIFFANCFYIRQ